MKTKGLPSKDELPKKKIYRPPAPEEEDSWMDYDQYLQSKEYVEKVHEYEELKKKEELDIPIPAGL